MQRIANLEWPWKVPHMMTLSRALRTQECRPVDLQGKSIPEREAQGKGPEAGTKY